MSCFEAGIAALHARGLSGSGVRVGLLDTGLEAEFAAALGSRLAAFRRVSDDGFEVLEAAPRDSGRHGSAMVRSLLAVAPGAALVVAEAIEQGDIAARVASGLDWLAGMDIDVVCLPLGLPPPAAPVARLVQALLCRGVAVVAAAGNGGAGRILAPADLPGVLSVGALDPEGRVAAYSASADLPFGVAPAVVVPAEGAGGTSSSAVRAAGLCALLVEAGLGAVEAAQAVAAQARPLRSQSHRARFGAVDPVAALAWERAGPPPMGPGHAQEQDEAKQPGGLTARLAERLRYAGPDGSVSALIAFRDAQTQDAALQQADGLRVRRCGLAPVILASGPAARIAALAAAPGLAAADTADVDRSAYAFAGVTRARPVGIAMP